MCSNSIHTGSVRYAVTGQRSLGMKDFHFFISDENSVLLS